MNEQMKEVWLEISRMLGEPTKEELDVFLRTWQRAMQAEREECAKIADGGADGEDPFCCVPVAHSIAAAIRARGQA